MTEPKRSWRPFWWSFAAVAALVAALAAKGLAGDVLGPLRGVGLASSPPADAAEWVGFNARLRAGSERAVLLLQLVAVAAFCLSRLLPATRWADRGRLGFVAAMVGLGVAGTLCARFGSSFALFAG